MICIIFGKAFGIVLTLMTTGRIRVLYDDGLLAVAERYDLAVGEAAALCATDAILLCDQDLAKAQ